MIAEAEEWAEDLKVPCDQLTVPLSSTGREFPRTAIALVEDSVEDGVPYFMALQQADARAPYTSWGRSEEHTSELQSRGQLVCRLLLEKKNKRIQRMFGERPSTST